MLSWDHSSTKRYPGHKQWRPASSISPGSHQQSATCAEKSSAYITWPSARTKPNTGTDSVPSSVTQGTLSWSPHISMTANKAISKTTFLCRNLHQCPQRLKEQAYLALFHSVLEYTPPVWDPHLKKTENARKGVQHHAARFVSSDYECTSSVTAMLKSLGRESLQDRRWDIMLTLMYKIVHAQVAVTIDDLLVKANSRTWTNHMYKFRHILATSAVYKHSFFPRTLP